MAGVGKLLKQAQKMQKQMEGIQGKLAEQIIEVSSGGGAINIQINGQGEFQAFKIDPEFLKEDAEFVEETLLGAVQEAAVGPRLPRDQAQRHGARPRLRPSRRSFFNKKRRGAPNGGT